MKLAVFGASGGIGSQVVRQALDADHKVTAVVRDRARLPVPDHSGLEVVTVAGLTDPEPLVPALAGSDVAISGVGPRSPRDVRVASSTGRAILAALEQAGVRRFVAVSAMPVGPVADGESWVNRRLQLPLLRTLLRGVYADVAAMEEEIRRSRTDWTVIRPPRLVNRPLTGRYRTAVGGNVPRRGGLPGRCRPADARRARRTGHHPTGGRHRRLTSRGSCPGRGRRVSGRSGACRGWRSSSCAPGACEPSSPRGPPWCRWPG